MSDDSLESIREVRHDRDQIEASLDRVEAELAALVRVARSYGHSWEKIAAALGVTRSAAWQRYGRGQPDPS